MDSSPSWFTRIRELFTRRPVTVRVPTRSHQELCETAMALLTLWVSFDDTEHESVARTTRDLLAGLTPADLGYLVLHLAGLARGLVHSMAEEYHDVDQALQALARSIHQY